MKKSLKSTFILDLRPFTNGKEKISVGEAKKVLNQLLSDFPENDERSKSIQKFLTGFEKIPQTTKHMEASKEKPFEEEIISAELKMDCDYYGGTGYCEPCDTWCCCYVFDDGEHWCFCDW